MRTVRHILQEKGYTIVSLTPDETVLDAISLMNQNSIGSLVVMDDQGLVGMLTERDYARKIALLDRKSSETTVGEIMSHAECVHIDQTVPGCMEMMTNSRCRHMVVINDEAVVGVVSIGDLVKSTIDEQKFEINQLRRYVWG